VKYIPSSNSNMTGKTIAPETPCCLYGSFSPEFSVASSDGTWTMQHMQGVMRRCQESELLREVSFLAITEGGFVWPATDESELLWRHNVAKSSLGSPLAQRSSIGRQIRFNFNGSWPWITEDNERSVDVQAFPQIPLLLNNGHPILQCRSKGNIPFTMIMGIMRAFEEEGHYVVHTTKFEPVGPTYHKGKWLVRRTNGGWPYIPRRPIERTVVW